MTRLRCPAAFLLLLCLSETLSSELYTYTINTKKWSHVLDDHFISVTVNPTDLLQGKAFGLGMNSTVAILKGLSPAYIRIGSADTGKYTFKRSRFPSEIARTDDEFIITESHWTTLNDVVRSAGLDVIVCLNAAHRNGASNKWDTRNSLELISFSDSQGYNLTFQLGYEVQRSHGLSGHQYGKDLKRLRTILNAFPRYQNSKLIGPDIRYLQRKDDVDFVNDVLFEGGSVLDAVTWHPRWPQPSKMKVSDISELGYEFPSDYIEWDRSQLGRVLQRSILKNPIWIGEPKTESTGTFAEGLLWARRLVLAGKIGIEVVMKQPSLMDISHPKPEYWIAFLHKRLLGKAVLETRAVNNQTEISVITHCTNPLFWSERSSKSVDGAVTVYAVNMGGKDQRVHVKGAWGGKSQVMLQYLLTSGSDPDSVFSQMTYLNGEPLMMTDDGNLPDITPRVRRMDRGVLFKLPPYSVGFWVIPDARVKICQSQPAPAASSNFENLSSGIRQRNIPNIRNMNQFIVDKLKNPVSDSEEEFYDRTLGDFSSERDLIRESMESPAPRASRRVRQITVEDIGQELKEKIREIRDMLETNRASADKILHPSENLRAAEEKISSLTEALGAATRLSNQQEEFGRFLHKSGLNQDFGALMMKERMGLKRSIGNNPLIRAATTFDPFEAKVRRFRRSLSSPEDDYEEESTESYSSEEENFTETGPNWKINYRKRIPGLNEVSDENNYNSDYSRPPVLKGIEDKYRTILSHRIQDGKRKLDDLRRQKAKKIEPEEPRKSKVKKPNTLGSDLQEEILMKEVEVLQKTEEAMTNLIKNHKKRQQTIQEIILHEITDIKEDRLSALEDIRQQKELGMGESGENERIDEVQRNARKVADALHFPQKTKRSITDSESSLNALQEEEKKSKIIKRSLDSSYERSLKRRRSKKLNRDDEDDRSSERESRRRRKSRSERLERMKNFIQSRERIRDRNILKRKHNRNLRKYKHDESDEESNEISGNDFAGKSEGIVIKEIQKDILKKPERNEAKPVEGEGTKKEKKIEEEQREEKPRPMKKEETLTTDNNSNNGERKGGGNENRVNNGQSSNNDESQKNKSRTEEKSQQESTTTPKVIVKKVKTEEEYEHIPLKIDKNRGLNVLKRISNLVESINTREKSKARKPSMDVEDLSEEFYGDTFSKISKRRHRRSHHHGEEVEESKTDEHGEGSVESPLKNLKELKALRREIKLRKLLERRMKKKKFKEEAHEGDHPEGFGSKSNLKIRLKEKHSKQASGENVTEGELVAAEEEPRTTAEGTEEVKTEEPSPMKGAQEQEVAAIHQMNANGMETELASPQETNTESATAKESPQSEQKEESNYEQVALPKEQEQAITKHPFQEDTIEGVTDRVASADVKNAVETDAEEKTESISEKVDAGKENSQSEDVQRVMSTEPPPTDTTIADMKSSSLLQRTTPEPAGEKTAEEINTVLVLPEIEGLMFNPLIVANPAEEMDMQQEERSDEPGKENRFILLDQYGIPEEAVREELYNESGEDEDVRQSGPPDVITELMEGDKLKPWKGAVLDTIENLKSKIDELNSSHKRSSFADTDTEGNDSSQFDERSTDRVNPMGLYPSAMGSHLSDLTGSTPEEDSSESDIANRRIMRIVPAEAILPEKRSRALRRSRRGIFDRRPQNPEERSRSFKRMVHGRHSPFGHKNEIPIISEGESFWKMAGSTVKAVFNDVIPDAYGKTKDKIENLGIAEYFKEFGKIVEQMKNLDRLFANIGQTAVRNYIKGTEGERGDYIQVIEKRRRSRRDVEEMKEDIPLVEEKAEVSREGAQVNTTLTPEVTTERITEKEPTTAATPLGNQIRAKGLRNYVRERPNDLIRDIFLMDSNPGIIEVTKSPPTTEPPQTIFLHPFESRYAKFPKMNNMHNRILRRDRTVEVQMPEMNRFAPWMKTTKEFINQALTTLQRQRELSEMIARESVNDLVKREIKRKVIGKRETGEDRHVFPVYQMPPNRKREIYGQPEESYTRYPSQLQPGVYIVPTEEMQNLRSEQIMKEAPATKPGMPNMVTLNIYYDKKKPREWDASKEEVLEADSDFMRYYHEPSYSWNPVPSANHGPEYVPETGVETRYLPQGLQSFTTEPKIHDPRLLPYGESYHEWIPRYPLPAVSKTQPPYLYPDGQYTYPKTNWQEFKHSGSEATSPGNGDSGWAVQFQPAKKKVGRSRDSLRLTDRQQRLLPDKKRSVGSKTDAGFPGLALPFWKFAMPKKQPETIDKTSNLESSESLEEIFAENRRRARLNALKQEEKPAEETENRGEEEDEDEEETEKSEGEISGRRRRDVSQSIVEFHDGDLIPEWFGTIQELDNNLHDYRNELERMMQVVAIPWFNYEEEEEEEEEDEDDDEIFPIQLHRLRRSVDDVKLPDKATIKDLKKLTDSDSSLEVLNDYNNSTKPTKLVNVETESGDALSHFFKYAYDSLVRMMKDMTGFI